MSERLLRGLVLVAAPFVCASCLVGPDYEMPETALPSFWTEASRRGAAPGEVLAADDERLRLWWKQLDDPLLDSLVDRAIAGNRDVQVALARLREARAVQRGSTAAFFPSIDATADYRRRQRSGVTESATNEGAERRFNDYSAGFDAAWEIDLFGGLRRAREQAGAERDAAEADLDDALVTLLAELARNYVELRSLQERIAIAERNADSQKQTLDLASWRHQAGLVGALDVEQAEYNLAETRSRIPALESNLAAARHRIAVLLGLPAGSLDAELATRRELPLPPPRVAAGLPADLLRRRPDVRAAERRLAAATAALGVATADLYPKLSLTGTFAVAATDFSSLDAAASRGYSVGPSLRWNIFDAGRLRSVVAQRSAAADAALASWEQAILLAIEEVENALAAFAREQQRLDRLAEARAAAREARELARLEYENGIVDFDRVLDASRALLVFEESHAVSEAAVTTNLVALYKALGGGWELVDCGDEGCRPAAPEDLAAGEDELRPRSRRPGS